MKKRIIFWTCIVFLFIVAVEATEMKYRKTTAKKLENVNLVNIELIYSKDNKKKLSILGEKVPPGKIMITIDNRSYNYRIHHAPRSPNP